MAFPLDAGAITHGIQLAVAPVFLLTSVSGMIGAVAGRLARVIDRARAIQELARQSDDPAYQARADAELRELRRRGRLANGCIALLTLCSFMIGLTIILLFLGETAGLDSARWAVWGFLMGVGCFLLALVCFMAETVIATRQLSFHRIRLD